MANPDPTIAQTLAQLDASIEERLKSIENLNKLFTGTDDFWQKLDKDISDATKKQQAINTVEQTIKSHQEKVLNLLEGTEQNLIDKIKTIKSDSKQRELQKKLTENITKIRDAVHAKTLGYTAEIKKQISTATPTTNFNYQTATQQAETATSTQTTTLNSAKDSLKAAAAAINKDSVEGFQKLLMDVMGGNAGQAASLIFLMYYLKNGKIAEKFGVQKGDMIDLASQTIFAGAAPLLSTIKNIGNLIEGYAMQLKAVLNMFVGIGKGIIGIPLRIMEYAADMGHMVKKENVELFNQLEKLQDSFRQSSTTGRSMTQMNMQLRGRRTAYLDPNNPAARLYGATGDNLIERQMEETASIIKAMGTRAELMSKAVTKNVTAANSAIANYYYKAKKLMNLSDDDMGKLTNMAISLGKSFPQVFDEISQSTANVAKRFSLDFKMMSTDVLTLRKDIVNFGHKSADELALVAGHIRQMGVSMSDAMAVFNKFSTFEDAATTAAQLSQTFGMVVDSMELLKAQSPDEILQQYKDAFIASGKSFETMDRFSKSLILQQTGLSDQAAQALFSAENAGKTYEEIMADVEANDPTERQTRSMEEMRDAIVELKTTLTKDFTSFFEAMQEGFTKKLFDNPVIRKSMEKMALAMDNIFLKFTKMDMKKLQPTIDALTGWIDKLSEFIASDEFLNKLTGIANGIILMLDGFVNKGPDKIKKGFQQVMDNLKPIFEFLADFGTQVLVGIGSSIINALPSIVYAINILLDDILGLLDPKKSKGGGSWVSKLGEKLLSPESVIQLTTSLNELFKKVFGDSASGEVGLVARLKDVFRLAVDGFFGGKDDQNSLGNRFFATLKEKFELLSKDEGVKNALTSLTKTFAEGLLTTLSDAGGLLSWGINAPKKPEPQPDLSKFTPTNPISPTGAKDLIISKHGAFKLDDKDDIMALKPGGAIDEYMKKMQNLQQGNKGEMTFSSENLTQLKDMLVEAMTTAAGTTKNDKELVINLDSQKVGSVLIKGGLVTMMTNPNIAGNQPTLNTNSINTSNGQTYTNAFRNA